jgi:hypothetical protein
VVLGFAAFQPLPGGLHPTLFVFGLPISVYVKRNGHAFLLVEMKEAQTTMI